MTTTETAPTKERFGFPTDANLMRAIFVGLLMGTAGVLYMDFTDLSQQNAATALPDAPPILPAIARPEIDPNAPQFLPTERIQIDEDTLNAPLNIELAANGILKFTGRIDPGAAERVVEQLSAQAEYVKTVELNSPGGSVRDALKIGAFFREAGFDTMVPDGGYCASSCPLVFASGTARIAGNTATIGVHQIYGATADISAPQAMSDAQVTTAEITRHLNEMGIDSKLWLHALDTPPQKLYYLTDQELKDYKLATKVN